MVVELSPADIKGQAGKILWQAADTADHNTGLQDIQEGGGKDIVGMEPSGMGKSDIWQFTHSKDFLSQVI